MYEIFEAIATISSLIGNFILMYQTYHNPGKPVPIPVVGLQVVTNFSWVTYSSLAREYYLFTTSFVNLTLQTVSIYFLTKLKLKHKNNINVSESETELRTFPIT
tara:strand:- start:138 stop:449 length:312 start_codon:yes stop_codon:yes gene_type:complete